MEEHIKRQARDIYRTVRMLKDRVCREFEARARNQGEPGAYCDITFAQANALMTIAERGELSLKELADILHVSPPSASTMVERLVESGLIIREQSTVDRREVRIRLTEQGKLHFAAMESQFLEYIGELLARLGPDYAAQWCDVYGRIREVIAEDLAADRSQEARKGAVG